MKTARWNVILSLGFVLLFGPVAAGPLEISADPETGPLGGVFTLILTNRTGQAVPYDSCSAPQVIGLANGAEIFCPDPPDPAKCELAVLPDGASLKLEWRPLEKACSAISLAPGLCEVRWRGFPQAAPARIRLTADPERRLAVTVEPGSARIGEKVRISIENTSGRTLTYNRCCYVPSVHDPRGRATHCVGCPECYQVVDLVEGEVLTYDWTPGEAVCDGTGELPGRHRIVWGGFYEGNPGSGPQYFGEAELLVLPPEERRLELALSADELPLGQTLVLTAQNPLAGSVWQNLCCDEPILIDEMGRESPCSDCTIECAPVRSLEILPGKTATLPLKLPGREDCGLRPGRWSVIWGPNFALVPGMDPAPPVFGYAEFTALSGAPPEFIRGNCDGLGAIDLTDPIRLLGFLFLGEGPMACPDACDGDDSGVLDLTDAVFVLNFLFLGGPPPAPPYPDPGPDPTPDGLGCGAS